MPRYKLILEYDGTGLVGWQRQKNGLSVQEILETATERFCGAAAKIGRGECLGPLTPNVTQLVRCGLFPVA